MAGSIDSVVSHALQGLNRAFHQVDTAARRVADGEPQAADAVALMTAETGVKANAAVLRSADEMTDRLLDIIA